MHWVDILLPIATLIIGSGLTMAGQALSDRRRETRERRARREQFRVDNFDIHRTAMLEMQEAIRDLTKAITSENVRRRHSGEYEYFESFRTLPGENLRRLVDNLNQMERSTERIKDEQASEDERNAFTAEIVKGAREMTELAENAKSYVEGSSRYFEGRWSFYDEFAKSISNLRLCMYRSGSNTVVQYGEEYIQAVAKWNERIVSEGTGELYEQVRKSRARLDRALANALTSGPYDKFKADDE
jgi:hypothetical protein